MYTCIVTVHVPCHLHNTVCCDGCVIGSQFIQLYQTPDNQVLSKNLLKRLERATIHHIKSSKTDRYRVHVSIAHVHN